MAAKTVDMGAAWGSRMNLMARNAPVNSIDNLKKAINEIGSKTYAGLRKAGKPTRYEGIFDNRGNTVFTLKMGKATIFSTTATIPTHSPRKLITPIA